MLEFLSLALLLLALLTATYLYLKWNFEYWNIRYIKGPKPQILRGTFPKTYHGQCNLVEELHEIYMKYKENQSCVGVFSGRSPKLFILDPDTATQVLKIKFASFHDNESSQWSSPQEEQLRFTSPFVSVGEFWKEKRSELVQFLTKNKIRYHYDAMKISAIKMIDYIKSRESNTVWDAKDLSNRFTCDAITKFIWGIEENTFDDKLKRPQILHMAETMLNQALRCVHYYSRTAAWPWLRRVYPVRFFPAISEEFFKKMAKYVMPSYAKGGRQGDSTVINQLAQLKQKKNLNDVQIAGHTTTVLIDGFETTAIVMAHCLLMLARNQRVQTKLRDILKNDTQNISSYEELMSHTYLDQCIQETLRIFPPLATLFKLCTDHVILDNYRNNTKVKLVPGDVIYISAYSLHRDPYYYENPEEYWPERFDNELGGIQKYKSLGVFLPFGDGPRMCPGMNLGLMEVKIGITELIRHFEVFPGSNTRTDNKVAADSFLLRLDGDINIRIKKDPVF
ncbi:putative cytochrome P450 28d1 [Haematobia irritans]|uniref:putative cytochrome P450 28d1 n=1 Tax=Haematobia irritans TaxID=7368 RepID=UPI003F50400D